MREAERESYDLQRTINAWKRLNDDSLTDMGVVSISNKNFVPTPCAACSLSITIELLKLCLTIFKANHSISQNWLSKDFIRCLFINSNNGFSVQNQKQGQEFKKLQKEMILEIAMKSESATKLVLEEFKLLFQAERNTAFAASVLGCPISQRNNNDIKCSKELAVLAKDILIGSRSCS